MQNNHIIDLESDSDESSIAPIRTVVANVGWIRIETSNGSINGLKIKVLGQPKVLRRHQTVLRNGRVHVYDPSRADKATFKSKVRLLLNAAGITERTVLESHHLQAEAFFLMQRPLNHFINNNPENNLRGSAPSFFVDLAGDTDNLLKFLMDATEDIIFENDRRVETLKATKVYAPGREGCTVVEYTKIGNPEMDAIVRYCNN